MNKKKMLIIGIILIGLMSISFILSSHNRSIEKLSSYECGLEPMGDAKIKLKIIYYIVGILYLLFDLEIIFLYPFASSIWLLNNFIGFLALILFIVLLTLTFIFEWFIGALNFS